jgi:hypothetical protein
MVPFGIRGELIDLATYRRPSMANVRLFSHCGNTLKSVSGGRGAGVFESYANSEISKAIVFSKIPYESYFQRANPRALALMQSVKSRSIGLGCFLCLNSSGVRGDLRIAQANSKEDQADKADDNRASRYQIEKLGYADLPFPEAPLGGAVLFFGGGWLTTRGLVRGNAFVHIGGWLAMVLGGVIFLLWALPYAADIVEPLL